MQIVLIAGGSGTRMQPLVTHKTLFPFFGLPIIEHVLNNLKIFDRSKIVIVTHPSTTKEIELIGAKYGATVVAQGESTGMSGAILSAKEYLDPNESVLVADAITIQESQAYETFAKAIIQNPTTILLGGRRVVEYKHGGYFVFDDVNKVVKIIEKPGAGNMPSPFLKLVLDYYPSASDMTEAMATATSPKDDIYEVALSAMIKAFGAEMIEVTGSHASLKHAYRVLDVMDLLLSKLAVSSIDESAHIAATAVVEGNVVIGPDVRIFDHATIKGPVYIGANSVVGNGALVRSSCIEANCEIGYNTEVARSYVGPGTKCHTSYVGDSILEGDINLAAGTITANLRFDGKNVLVNLPSGKIDTGRRKFGAILARGVKTGIHASIMPGSVVESNKIIGTEGLYVDDNK